VPPQRRKQTSRRPGGPQQGRRTPPRPPVRPGGQAHHPGQAAGRPLLTPQASPLRHTVERRSATVLLFLRGLPRAVPPLTVTALVAGGLLAPGAVGALCLALVLLFFGWLLFLSWPGLAVGARYLRLAVLAVMAVGIAARLAG
jgi:hypothetical protein